MTGPWTRRAFLGAAAAGGMAAAGGLAGCGGGSIAAIGGTRLAYWNFFTGGDGTRMLELIDAYRAEAPDISVKDTTLAWGSPFYTKLAMACEGGRAPDLASLHASRIATFGHELVDPWDLDELAARGVSLDDFPQPAIDRLTVDGQLMGLPLDTHPLVLFYNTEMCEQAGLLDTDGTLAPIEGAEAFLDAGRRLAEISGSTGIAYGAADALASWMLFWSVFTQLGGTMELPDGGPAVVDTDACVQAFSFIRDLCDGVIASPVTDGGAAPAGFASEQSGFLLIGPWEVGTCQTAGIPFSMTQFPALFGDTPYIRADSHSLVLPRQASLDDAVRSAAYDMAVSMLNNSLDWAKGGHIPALSTVVDSSEYLALDPQARYRGAADVAAFDPDAYFSGSGSTLMAQAGQLLGGVATGDVTPEQATTDFVAWLDGQLSLGSPL